ncbi:CBS domain-containing protein CBSX2, chloroplastic [Planktothrix tepida]|uniref:CBS domain-containing protein CBSX2, chloroplastic n=2 Tax=Planktothrix TaxID=54304 RepID=A0A9W4G5U0_9CYAN|nr:MULTISPECIES: CBS domain-containing protein [Planktothrix]CAD5948035.1 CBS domain-containing protein CBSX2, chloroplastic [Planktothrix pseudagardhii]CAD5962607.1 CBS domain-containing protein CBSX2, chloroplastic [Planktothrix tepida]CUR34833.1 putative signal transduction protein with CBS domains [Planktothrix tepida PCC 9214]
MPKTVAEVMTPNPILAQPEMPLREALQLMVDRHIGCLPVVNSSGHLVGIISGTDLMWQESGVTPPAYITFLDSVIYLENFSRYEQELHKALGQTVGEVMTPEPLVTITPNKSLSDAARLFNEKRVHRLPVVEQSGKVIGILTCGDILRVMATTQSSKAD